MASKNQVTVRPTGPSSFAVIGADGATIRDNFPTPQVAWMWAAKRGLHQGAAKREREATAIPSDLEDERILGLKVLARLSNTSYGVFLSRAKSGEYGPLIQTGERTFGLRLGDWKRSIAAREIQTK